MAPKAEKYLDPKVENDLVKDIDDFVERSLRKRKKKEGYWKLAREFVAGSQWQRLEAETNKLEPIAGFGRNNKWRITINRLLPGMQARLAHVLKNRPIGVVMPETNDEDDRNSARVGNDVAEFYERYLELPYKLSDEEGPELFTTGNVFEKWTWDPTAGKEIMVQKYVMGEDGQPVLDPLGKPIPDGPPETMAQGEPSMEVVMPEEMIPDPAARKFHQCEAVVHRTIKPLDYLRRLCSDDPEALAKVKKLAPLDPQEGHDAALATVAKSYGMTERDLQGCVEIQEFWAKPDTVKWPEGLYVLKVRDEILKATPTPKGHDHIPFVHLQEVPLSNDLWGTSTVIQNLDPQKALNLCVSRDEYRRTMQRPKLVADYESGLDEEAWSNDDKEVVFKNRGTAIEWVNPSNWQGDIEATNSYAKQIDDQFGNASILMGDANGETRSGRQVWLQSENAGTVLSGPAHSIERAKQRGMQLLLKLLKANANEQRTIQIVGKNKDIEVKDFQGSDLDGCGDYYVEPGSATPMSPDQKRQMILDLVDRQILPPNLALKMLPVPSDLDAKMDEDQLDRDRANEENLIFQSLTPELVRAAMGQATLEAEQAAATGGQRTPDGQPDDELFLLRKLGVEPRPEFENNEVHLEVLNRFRKTKAYRALPPAIQAVVDAHAEKHVPPPPPSMPMGGGKGAPGASASPGPTPGALQPGGTPAMMAGAAALGPEQLGDVAAGMPPIPQTPTPGNPARM